MDHYDPFEAHGLLVSNQYQLDSESAFVFTNTLPYLAGLWINYYRYRKSVSVPAVSNNK